MPAKRVILARDPNGDGVAVGPLKTARTVAAARDEIASMPGWQLDDTVPLISAADLKHLAPKGTPDA